jgi:cytochrome P450
MAAPSAPGNAPLPGALPNPCQSPELRANPYAVYARLREANPVFQVPLPFEGPGVVILTRHADVEAVLRDGRVSVDRLQADVAQRFRAFLPPQLVGEAGLRRSMLLLDGEDHARVRGLVNKAFTPRRVGALEGRIRAIVDELLAPVLVAGRMDLMHDLAEPLPAIVIAELLGVPSRDHRQFKEWAAQLVNALGEGGPLARGAGFDGAFESLTGYMREVIEERRRDPGDDLISDMIAAQQDRDALTDGELLANSLLLLLAGHETTTNLIGNGVLALLRHRDQWERLRADPSLLPNAIEELLRYDSPVQATVRVPTEDLPLGDHVLRKGALVVCLIGAANRDPLAYRDPDRLDVTRERVQHLSFGFGQHFCLGAGLARLEGRLVFGALLEGAPDLALESDEVEYRPNPLLRGPRALPLSLG